ncbi:MAG: DNA-directed RNA polymerase subunit omega [Candidatus Brocadia sp.]|nr:DNA-directed RNA polymerase subunit omega [Candidatus Brocadia sp.]
MKQSLYVIIARSYFSRNFYGSISLDKREFVYTIYGLIILFKNLNVERLFRLLLEREQKTTISRRTKPGIHAKNTGKFILLWNIFLIIGVNVNYKNIDELAKQVGGSLRLTSLIISRARQIIKKAPVLVETETDDPVKIAFLELMKSKIKLNEGDSRQPKALESKI